MQLLLSVYAVEDAERREPPAVLSRLVERPYPAVPFPGSVITLDDDVDEGMVAEVEGVEFGNDGVVLLSCAVERIMDLAALSSAGFEAAQPEDQAALEALHKAWSARQPRANGHAPEGAAMARLIEGPLAPAEEDEPEAPAVEPARPPAAPKRRPRPR